MAANALRPALAALLAAALLLVFAGGQVVASPAPTAVANTACPVTPYTVGAPVAPQTTLTDGESFTLTWHGNDALWAGLDRAHQGRWFAAPGVKVLWVRIAPGQLSIVGKRLDGAAPPLRADIPHGYGNAGIQASGLIFPTPGCWQVTGSVPGHELTFVVQVLSGDENPADGGVPAPGPDLWASVRRPLHLPMLDPSRTCPASPGRTVTRLFGPAVGEEPAYAAGFGTSGVASIRSAREEGGWYYIKVLWIASPDYHGPLLIRGARLDGPGAMGFGSGPEPADELDLAPGGSAVPSSPQGTPLPTGGWSNWPSFARVPGPGCYAFQVDGWSFSETIVVSVAGGPATPAA